MRPFEPGEVVVCVNADRLVNIFLGKTYVIEQLVFPGDSLGYGVHFNRTEKAPGVRLVGVFEPGVEYPEINAVLYANRFRRLTPDDYARLREKHSKPVSKERTE